MFKRQQSRGNKKCGASAVRGSKAGFCLLRDKNAARLIALAPSGV
jgi:hypothetical protein